MSMTSPTKSHHVTQIILKMSLCDKMLVTLSFLWDGDDLTREIFFFLGLFVVQARYFWAGHRYGFEV